jgi:8-oxo-dGTP pyrophosphatase MutT (NUDIX family)
MIPLSLVEEQLVRTPARSIDTGGETWRRAAVAAVFRAAGGDTELLFVRRAAQKKDPWSRQVGFPGGHEEEDDDDLVASAGRETLEEVGIDVMDGGRLLGSLDVLQARARSKIYPMSIHPYAFVLDTDTDRPLIPNPAEVDRAFWVPLSRLANPGHRVWYDAQRVGVPFSFPAIDVDSGDVPLWGLTHHMVLEILHRLGLVADVSALTMPRPIPK